MENVARLEARREPRIPATKLGEYLVALAARRRRIVSDQKYPPTCQVTRYADAERAVIEFLTKGRDPSTLARWRTRLINGTPRSKFDAERRKLCLEGISAFSEAIEQLGPEDAAASTAPNVSGPLHIGGVSISVRPEVLLRRDERGRSRCGYVKLYFSKNHPLADKAGEYVSTLLARYAGQNLFEPGERDDSLTVTLDVFARRAFRPPKARLRRMEDIAAACEEIAILWESL